jgi:hypothetical protein
MPKSKKAKNLKNNQYRIIKISKDALFEFIYESIIDKQAAFFDIPDVTKIVSHHNVNFETGEYIIIVHNDNKKTLKLPEDIDLGKLLSRMPDTTSTLFSENRYVELTLKEIKDIQS